MKKIYKIAILMSTYNPSEYIIEQIESIKRQKYCDIDLYIRDDGSKDKEYLNLIDKYCKNIYFGENIGVSKSIHKLAKNVNNLECKYDYYAFADQDDVWLEEKLYAACKVLDNMNSKLPSLYYSNLQVVDNELYGNRKLFNDKIVKNTKEQALAQIFTFGCTCVYNRKCLEIFSNVEIGTLPFDNIIFMQAIFLGNTFYDENSYILYRQHGNNVSGQKVFGLKKIFFRLKQIRNFYSDRSIFNELSIFLLNNYGNILAKEDLELLNKVANYKNSTIKKVKLLFYKKIKAGYMPKDLYRIIRIIFDSY